MKINDLIKKHALLIYFFLTILLSWGFVIVLAKPGNIPLNQDKSQDLLPVLYVSMLIGPSCAGLLLLAITRGREGFYSLMKMISRWNVKIHWYFVALLFTPVSAVLLLTMLNQFNGEFQSTLFQSVDLTTQILNGAIAGIMVGIFEEIGWTGFAVSLIL